MTYVTERERDAVTVGEAAELAGVTVRALHHWDEIGLASPSLRTAAGYRRYTEADVQRLDRVVAYREAGLGLDAIRAVLDDAAAEIGATLREQRAKLAERIGELQRLDERLARLTEAHERGVLLGDEEQTEIFGTGWDPAASLQARAAWGDSPQWAQFAERSASRTPGEWRSLSAAMSALQDDLGHAVARDVTPGSPEANALVERHREVFSNFFPLTRRMQVCLGRMFEADPGFAAHYDGIRAGLAAWFRRSIDDSARAHGIDPETATWE
ncbi:MerR family transcriptional regulator [Actinorhabdospora filicis]|uniref:MerR family transcriptional regulator n=1 Tax=Actinorhabdospora filicis TaxID=1785913 RepID=A0A9W6SLP1_9ACTN|nr:MerR family transcriptional regulator [Actinorhabdospora filicis]GLZ78039.1 MerR family transcriptional regulator [Actinorhabdospora filicis]